MTSSTSDFLNRLEETPMATAHTSVRCSSRRSSSRALRASFKKLDPRYMVRNPVMFVTEVGARRHHGGDPPRQGARRVARLRVPDLHLALVHGPLRQLRRGAGRGARQGASRRAPARPQEGVRRRDSGRDGTTETVPVRGCCARATRSLVPAHEFIPGGRRDHRRRGDGRRVGHHRRVGARPPRSRAATDRPSPAARPSSPISCASA